MKIYLAHTITGLSYDEVVTYYNWLVHKLRGFGYTTLCPMTGKEYLRNERELKPGGYIEFPVSTNHAIFERDMWMIQSCDLLLADLTGARKVSIGVLMELAVASYLRKHTIVVMEKTNPAQHAFVLEAADIVFEDIDDAIPYFERLAMG